MIACVTGYSFDAVIPRSHLNVKWKSMFLGDSTTHAKMHEDIRNVLLDLNFSDNRSAHCLCQPLADASDVVEVPAI